MDLSLKEMTLITVLDSVDITKFTIDGFLEVSNLKEKEFEEIADSIFENYSKDLKVLELGQKYYKNFPEYLRGAKEYQHSWEEENDCNNKSIGLIVKTNPLKIQAVQWKPKE